MFTSARPSGQGVGGTGRERRGDRARRYYRAGISPVVRPLRRLVHGMQYRGDAVECPLCQGRFSGWLGGEKVGLCPACESLSRHRLLWLYLQNELASTVARPRPLRLLHFAPEFCLSRILKRIPGVEYITADLFEPEAMLRLDITAIDLPDESVDMVLCSHVLEHVPDDARAMRELRRIVRPGWAGGGGAGGRVLLQIPQNLGHWRTYEDWSIESPAARARAFGQRDHVRVYGADFTGRLHEAGFYLSVVRVFEQIPEELRRRYGLWDDRIYSCTKRPAHVAAADGGAIRVARPGRWVESHAEPESAERELFASALV